MPKMNDKQSQFFVGISKEADKILTRVQNSENLTRGQSLDKFISLAKEKFVLTEIEEPVRPVEISSVILRDNKKWIKNFAKKANLSMSVIIDRAIRLLS